jgi:hypothetical protein
MDDARRSWVLKCNKYTFYSRTLNVAKGKIRYTILFSGWFYFGWIWFPIHRGHFMYYLFSSDDDQLRVTPGAYVCWRCEDLIFVWMWNYWSDRRINTIHLSFIEGCGWWSASRDVSREWASTTRNLCYVSLSQGSWFCWSSKSRQGSVAVVWESGGIRWWPRRWNQRILPVWVAQVSTKDWRISVRKLRSQICPISTIGWL